MADATGSGMNGNAASASETNSGTESWVEIALEATGGGGVINSPTNWDAQGRKFNPWNDGDSGAVQ